ncbi:MAG TPA: hypothetical protein VFF67_00170 [Thermoplasmata archaeon]|nr:hypothetical protein [Thermoplasmata archaeon]
MSKIRTTVGRALLGYLAAEWVGALLAYAVALIVFSLLIAGLIFVVAPGALVVLPMVVVLAGAGLYMLAKSTAVPRALLQLARSWPGGNAATPSISGSSTSRVPPPVRDWRPTRVLERVATLRALDDFGLAARSGALPIVGGDFTVRDLAAGPRLLPPRVDLLPVYRTERRIPLMITDELPRVGPIRIVDLSEARARSDGPSPD